MGNWNELRKYKHVIYLYMYLQLKNSFFLFTQRIFQSLRSLCSRKPNRPSKAPMWRLCALRPAQATRRWPSPGKKTMRSLMMRRSTTRRTYGCRGEQEVRRRWRSIRPHCSSETSSSPARGGISVWSPTILDLRILPRPDSPSTVSLECDASFYGHAPLKILSSLIRMYFGLVPVLPSFTKTPMDLSIRAGATARLECAAVGHPSPQIAWQKDGGTDFPAARERRMHVMPEDDVFFIVDVKTEDIGVYSCTAQNTAGAISANATLTVLGERKAPISGPKSYM